MKWKFQKKTDNSRSQNRSPSSSNTFSYHSSRLREDVATGRRIDASSSQKYHRSSWQLVPTLLIIIVGLVCVVYSLLLDSDPKIAILGDKNQSALLQDVSVYRSASQKILAGSLMNKLKLTINTDAVATKLKEQFPEIKQAAITVPLASHRLIFELEAALPALTIASQQSGPYIIDKDGRAVLKTKDMPDPSVLGLPHVTDDTSLELEPGRSILPKEQVSFILNVINQLSAKRLEIKNLTLPAEANELHLRLKGEGYYVKFNMVEDARLQVGSFLAVKDKLSGQSGPKKYIDVRVPEKVFYK